LKHFAAPIRSKTELADHHRQQTSNIKRISTKSFSHNRKSQIVCRKNQSLVRKSLAKNYASDEKFSFKRKDSQTILPNPQINNRPTRETSTLSCGATSLTRECHQRNSFQEPEIIQKSPDHQLSLQVICWAQQGQHKPL